MIVLRRVAFWAALVSLCVLMLWPALKLPETQIHRPDLIAHALSFGFMTLLTVAARLFGPRSLGMKNVLLSGALVLIVSSLTEWAQGLPGINRVRGMDDAIANGVGIFGVVVVCLLVGAFDDALREPRA